MDELHRERGVDRSGALSGTRQHFPSRLADDFVKVSEVRDCRMHRAEVAGEDRGWDIGPLDPRERRVQAREGLPSSRHGGAVPVIKRLSWYAREERAVACRFDIERDR